MDHSNVETEGDLMTFYVGFELNLPIPTYGEWSSDIIDTYGGMYSTPTTQQFVSYEYNELFQSAVQKRIDYYKNELKSNPNAGVEGYTQDKSNVQPMAIKKIFDETDNSLIGPKMDNGSYYSTNNQQKK